MAILRSAIDGYVPGLRKGKIVILRFVTDDRDIIGPPLNWESTVGAIVSNWEISAFRR